MRNRLTPLSYLHNTFGLDLRSLAVFRIGLGVTLLIDLSVRASDLDRFYTDSGMFPRSMLRESKSLLPSVHALSGQWELQAALFVLAAVFACMLIAGWRTRVATIVSWYLLQSLHVRNPFVLNGGDVLLRCMMMWAIFLPLGACVGLDARRVGPPPERTAFGMASVGLVVQLALLYIMTAAFKSGAVWLEGSALYYTLSIDEIASPTIASVLLQTRPLERLIGETTLATLHTLGLPVLGATPWATVALTYATLVLEYVGPLLLLCPWCRGRVRVWVVAVFIGFHVCTDICLEIGLFALICVVAWTALLPGWLWDRVDWRLPVRAISRRHCWPLELALALLVLFTVHWNLSTIDTGRRVIPHVTAFEQTVFDTLQLRQRWSMFAPTPGTRDGWWRVPARLLGGGEVDLSTGERPSWVSLEAADGHKPALHPENATLELDRSKPSDVAALFPNHRHRKLFNNVRRSRQITLRPRVAQFLCRQWNATHSGPERIHELRLIYMYEQTPAPGQPTPPVQPLTIWHHTCADVSLVGRAAGSFPSEDLAGDGER